MTYLLLIYCYNSTLNIPEPNRYAFVFSIFSLCQVSIARSDMLQFLMTLSFWPLDDITHLESLFHSDLITVETERLFLWKEVV